MKTVLVIAALLLTVGCAKDKPDVETPVVVVVPPVAQEPTKPAPAPAPEPAKPSEPVKPAPEPVKPAPQPEPAPVVKCNGTWKKTQQFVVGACSRQDLIGACYEVANTKVKFDCGLEFTCVCN